MKYASGEMVKIGDEVIADGMRGKIVCDFDNRQFMVGYESWDTPTGEMVGGGYTSSGVMVETTEAGLIYYELGTVGVELIRASGA